MADDVVMDHANPAWRRTGRMLHIVSASFQMAQSFMQGEHGQFVDDGAKLVTLFAEFYKSAEEASEDIVQFAKENGHGMHVVNMKKEAKSGNVPQKSDAS